MGRLKNFVIMLDGEWDNSQRQWRIRHQSDDRDELVAKKGTGFSGNPQNVPRSEVTINPQPLEMTELIHNVTQKPFRGGIYQVLG